MNGDPSSRYAGNLNFSFAYVEGNNINDRMMVECCWWWWCNVWWFNGDDDDNDGDDDNDDDEYMYLCMYLYYLSNDHQNILPS